ncbi:TetR family transcriptional regulator [Virgisporangium aliadipatigenens]|uniref:TetR family transcriptional regulator n=1 Tax=Virgisporangium aliadipatigenens TaxID=741659 RepID=A0A8J4DQL1_9ACTN|nr:WHG domain-containing protein [Virgisporangium aliadipatigenens]GIJ45838.1 TetR family transcriptional regulator [Virgisporangium aliadipatigenens]
MTSATTGPSRRERLRAATVAEILTTAHRLLVTDGPTAVTLRAISREMGMTAPALYRYYPSLEDLMEHLRAQLSDECTAYIAAEMDKAGPVDSPGRLYQGARAFRTWSKAHPIEFAEIFAAHEHGAGDGHPEDGPSHEAGMRFAAVFLNEFIALWQRQRFPIAEHVSEELRVQLQPFLDQFGVPLPVGALQVFLSAWIRLYGAVALEIFGHLHFGIADVTPVFEAELADVAARLGVEYQAP